MNLLRQLGGNTSLCALLKLQDTDKLAPRDLVKFHQSTSPYEHVYDALSSRELSPFLREAVIVNGSGSPPRGMTHAPGVKPGVVPSDDQLWKAYTAGARCYRSEYLDIGRNEERLINHRLGMDWCFGAIRAHEERSGINFDVVVYVRPDLIWWRPFVSTCEYAADQMWMGCDQGGCDMFFTIPRKYAAVLSQTELHRDCAAPLCCGFSENLHTYAKQTALGGAQQLAEAQLVPHRRADPGDIPNFQVVRSEDAIKSVCDSPARAKMCMDLMLKSADWPRPVPSKLALSWKQQPSTLETERGFFANPEATVRPDHSKGPLGEMAGRGNATRVRPGKMGARITTRTRLRRPRLARSSI